MKYGLVIKSTHTQICNTVMGCGSYCQHLGSLDASRILCMNILLIMYGLGSGWLKVQTHICVGCAGCGWCQPTTFHYMFSSVYFYIFVYIEVESTHIGAIVTGCGGLWLVAGLETF